MLDFSIKKQVEKNIFIYPKLNSYSKMGLRYFLCIDENINNSRY